MVPIFRGFSLASVWRILAGVPRLGPSFVPLVFLTRIRGPFPLFVAIRPGSLWTSTHSPRIWTISLNPAQELFTFLFSEFLCGRRVSCIGHLQFGSVVDLNPWICVDSSPTQSPLTTPFSLQYSHYNCWDSLLAGYNLSYTRSGDRNICCFILGFKPHLHSFFCFIC